MRVRKFRPPFLRSGDEVAIISPAFAIDENRVQEAVTLLENWGLRVSVGKNAFNKNGPFAGHDDERLSDIQEVIDKINIKAVFCSRGGYGMLRIIDRIDFSPLKKHPKWFVGFSDITVLHMWLSEKCNLISVHGEMPLNYTRSGKSAATLESLHNSLFGEWLPVLWEGKMLRPAQAEGEMTGGNLSLLYSLIGTPAEPKTNGKILFIEEVGEQYYHLDRMLTSLKLAGKLKGLAALVAGGFSKMEETVIPWGKTAESIISDIVSDYSYPVFFNFPAGHIPDNRSFYIGARAKIEILSQKAALTFV